MKICRFCKKPYATQGKFFCSMACGKAEQRAVPTADRFWSKVRKAEGCWQWTGALQRDGYAHFQTQQRKTVSSHRYSYELHVGPIPEGMDLLHSCDNRGCVNPAHLRPGTHLDNMRDAYARRRHAHGVRSIHAKLNEDQVRAIRARSPKGQDARDMAASLGVGVGVVQAVIRRKTWRFVE